MSVLGATPLRFVVQQGAAVVGYASSISGEVLFHLWLMFPETGGRRKAHCVGLLEGLGSSRSRHIRCVSDAEGMYCCVAHTCTQIRQLKIFGIFARVFGLRHVSSDISVAPHRKAHRCDRETMFGMFA